MSAPTTPRERRLAQAIERLKVRETSLTERIGHLMTQRADVEDKIAALTEELRKAAEACP